MSCHNIDRAFQHDQVNCGFYPVMATAPGEIRTKPGLTVGARIKTISPDEALALYSARNPSASDHPPPRPAALGADHKPYVYLYARDGSLTGWFPRWLTKPDPREHHNPNTGERAYADGPANLGFEIGAQPCRRGTKSGCGTVSPTKPLMVVTAEKAHYRYSPRGTSVHYLHRNDQVRVLIANGPHGFHFTEITKAAADGSARPGGRGWITANALRRLT